MIAAALLLALTSPAAAPGDQFCIARIHDGDTIRRCDGQRLRLADIDAPELRGSPACATPQQRATRWCDYEAGIAARDALAGLMASGSVQIVYLGRNDRYRRPLVRVLVGGRDAGEMLIARGLARRW